MFLQILVDGGLIGLITFLLIPFFVLFVTRKNRSKILNLVAAGIAAIGLGMMFEIYSSGWTILFLFVLYLKIGLHISDVQASFHIQI